MDIGDYLIDPRGKNWSQLLSPWSGTIPPQFTLWLVNKLGDLFVVIEDGSVHMLDVGSGVVTRLADSRDHFADLLGQGDNAGRWLLLSLVDECASELPPLTDAQCYGFKIPPLLGGKYTLDNIEPTSLAIHYSLLADIHRQTKDLPDGTKIKAVVVD